jgi:hypothetical protein
MASKHNTENSLLPYAVIKAATVGKNTALLPPPFGSPQMLQANSGAMMNAITNAASDIIQTFPSSNNLTNARCLYFQ